MAESEVLLDGPPKDSPKDPAMAKAVLFIRSLRGWSQRRLARAAGVDPGQISRYENGLHTPTRAVLKRLAASARVPFALVELALPYLRECAREYEGPGPDSAPEGAAGARAVESVAAVVARSVAGIVEVTTIQELSKVGLFGTSALSEEGLAADEVWQNFADLSESQQVALVEGGRSYRSATLCLRVCEESERVAASSPGRALGLARVALAVAARFEGTGACRSRLMGYACGHFANALRVANDFAQAERSFAKAWKLWEAGSSAEDVGLDAARLFDLEASLRRAQRQFDEALRLHDRALSVAALGGMACILLNKAGTYQQRGDYELAIATLTEAAQRLDEKREPRQLCVLRFNIAANLCHLERYAEAENLALEVRRLAESLGHDLDLVRVRWLEGRIALGLGRREDAIAALEEVRRELADRALPYDTALASLDLAVLFLEDGRTAEVRGLAEEMIAIFITQKVGREALMALQVFDRAVRTERATADLARRLAEYLEQARRDPRLPFRP